MDSSFRPDYILTVEQRQAGYSVKFVGENLCLYLNGKKVGSFNLATILQFKQAVQNHMEMQKSGIEFGKGRRA